MAGSLENKEEQY